MASNRPAPAPEVPFVPGRREAADAYGPASGFAGEGSFEEWNPSEGTVQRGRHRVAKQRGLARSSTVLGVGVIAAVGAGGMATAAPGKAPVHITMPQMPSLDPVTSLLPGSGDGTAVADDAPSVLGEMGVAPVDTESSADAGEALRARIMAQAAQQEQEAEAQAQKEAEEAAAQAAAEQASMEKAEAEARAEAAKKAEAEAKAKAEAERLAKLAASYTAPAASYTVTSTYMQAGSMWSSGYHTGLDLAAPTGTLLKAVHTGTVTEAGWAGSYGYRTILTLEDGTELWYCHQSSINVSVGQKVTTGDVIGRVGATGNVTGPHLHLEVHPGGGDGVDPMAWLAARGVSL
ncbi:M23 family metallopeptidase [Streptomyces sp. UH6]|uniref:M23 family metallopeptidase n=1 Tax=Streptomyces sp. UH6 TaxID=2748379 RepID=UPI0015D4DBA9|nr:M23 family metallopeptidase [Streptomyces sp. UH6]NYV77200.1 M23 family metallopeptidase [Streptomyces sp. UH6]